MVLETCLVKEFRVYTSLRACVCVYVCDTHVLATFVHDCIYAYECVYLRMRVYARFIYS